MENLAYYLPLLACPLMIVVLLFFMKGIFSGDDSNKKGASEELQKNMKELMEQNKKLAEELESMKK